MSTPTQDLKNKSFVFDYDSITVRRSAQIAQKYGATDEIEGAEGRAAGRAEVIASVMVGWTADEILDMPASRFAKLQDGFFAALRGEIPNGNVTNS